MSSRTLTIAGYLVFLLAGVTLEILARRPGSRVPRMRSVFSLVMRSHTGRVGMAAGWAWLGLHYFVR